MFQNVHTKAPLYCDIGPHQGQTRIDVTAYLYLTDKELAQYQKHGLYIALRAPDADGPKPAEDDAPDRAHSG